MAVGCAERAARELALTPVAARFVAAGARAHVAACAAVVHVALGVAAGGAIGLTFGHLGIVLGRGQRCIARQLGTCVWRPRACIARALSVACVGAHGMRVVAVLLGEVGERGVERRATAGAGREPRQAEHESEATKVHRDPAQKCAHHSCTCFVRSTRAPSERAACTPWRLRMRVLCGS